MVERLNGIKNESVFLFYPELSAAIITSEKHAFLPKRRVPEISRIIPFFGHEWIKLFAQKPRNNCIAFKVASEGRMAKVFLSFKDWKAREVVASFRFRAAAVCSPTVNFV